MPKKRQLKIVVDTNLWVSFIISKKVDLPESLFVEGKIRLLFSEELLTEIRQTVTKPKLIKYFGDDAFEQMLTVFEPYIDFIPVESIVTVCRDSKDNFLLALSVDGNADYLLTGDKDLLVLKKFRKTSILTISSFTEKISNHR